MERAGCRGRVSGDVSGPVAQGGIGPETGVVAISRRIVSTLQPVCSMSKMTNSDPALPAMRLMPLVSNSQTNVPSETPPESSFRLTGLFSIVISLPKQGDRGGENQPADGGCSPGDRDSNSLPSSETGGNLQWYVSVLRVVLHAIISKCIIQP